MPPKKKQAAKKKTSQAKVKASSRARDLPVESLRVIFQMLYLSTMVILENTPKQKASPGGVYRDKPCELSVDGVIVGGRYEPHPPEPKPEVASFSYLLHQVSAVCRQWRDVIQTLPEYWTRVVIFIDEDPTPLTAVKKQITRTKGLPLDVLVTRRNKEDSGGSDASGDEEESDEESVDSNAAEQERSRARAVMDALAPIVPRCRSFVFDVKYSSSLPFISQDFRGAADDLRALKLRCKVDNGNNDQDPLEAPDISTEDEFTFPKLSTIVLDGCTFMDACNVPSWTSQLGKKGIDTLSISNFTAPEDDEEEFDMYAFTKSISDIHYIRHLTLAHVDVAYESGTMDEGYGVRVDNLTLIGQPHEWANEFNFMTYAFTWCFVHLIDTGLVYESMPMTYHLRLENVPDLGPEFSGAFQRFFGNRLDIVSCEEFSDKHLDVIVNNCHNLRRLYLIDCPTITVKGLKAMITTREELVGDDDDDEGRAEPDERNPSDETESIVECTDEEDEEFFELHPEGSSTSDLPFKPIHRLHVKGHPKKLSKADRKWFEEHLESFSWD